MIDRLYYLFYKVVKPTQRNGADFFKAFIGFCFLEYMNLGSIFGIANHYLKYRVPKNGPIYAIIVVFGSIVIYNYFTLWVRNERIVSKYEELQNKNGGLLIWLFIILSFTFYYLVLTYFVEYRPN